MARRIVLTIALVGASCMAGCGPGSGTPGPVGLAEISTPTPTPAPGMLLHPGETELPPGEVNVVLELAYRLVPTVGTEQPVTFSTTIPLSPALGDFNRTASGEGEILEDVIFTVGQVTAHNVADWIIHVDAALDPSVADEPLSLRFVFTGQGYASVQNIRVGAHMDAASAPTHEYTLSLPLIDGASESFDVEGWIDILEWTVTLHLQ